MCQKFLNFYQSSTFNGGRIFVCSGRSSGYICQIKKLFRPSPLSDFFSKKYPGWALCLLIPALGRWKLEREFGVPGDLQLYTVNLRPS